jgi:hypothetical protein
LLSKTETDGELPKKGGFGGIGVPTFGAISVGAIIIWLVVLFLVAKFLGLTRLFLHIDPYGLENLDFVSGALAVGIGVLYKEVRDLRKEMNDKLRDLTGNLQQHGERLARLEAKRD